MRTTLPSFAGFRPRSEARIAFSMAPSCDGSNGCATMSDGSGTDRPASWLSGILDAVGLDVHAVENRDRRAARAHARQLVAHVLERDVSSAC